MDKRSLIGFGIIFLLLMTMMWYNQPSKEDMERRQHTQDSLRVADSLLQASKAANPTVNLPSSDLAGRGEVPDSVKAKQFAQLGAFATAGTGSDVVATIGNEVLRLTVSPKGGYISDALLVNHTALKQPEVGKDFEKVPVHLLNDVRNRFEYILPISGTQKISTADLYFKAEEVTATSVAMRAYATNGGYIEQRYTLRPGEYMLDYALHFVGLEGVLAGGATSVQLNWVNYLNKLEKSPKTEQTYASAYYRPVNTSPEHCSCTSSDEVTASEPSQWISHAQQFFNSTLVAKDAQFKEVLVQAEVLPETDKSLKKLATQAAVSIASTGGKGGFPMQLYLGPNDYTKLKSYDLDMHHLVPFGSGILGVINRFVIRPIFMFLIGFISNYGIVILILTLLVKAAVFPLTYRMLRSQAKMAALKPDLEKLRAKYADDPQKLQMEQMSLYQASGVNPLGGCLPMLLQMPVWFALYRFFPAAFEFRHKSFLWADDLSSFDSIANLSFNLPFFGSHISLFTILWTVTTLLFTYYNSRNMDFSSNPAMKYMQYIMPVVIMPVFNSVAAGLSCYLVFSNLLNILQNVFSKYLFNQDAIRAELEENRKKPKTGGFAQRLESAIKMQQEMQGKKQTPQK